MKTVIISAAVIFLLVFAGCNNDPEPYPLEVYDTNGIPVPLVPAGTVTVTPVHRVSTESWRLRHIQKVAEVKNDQKIIFFGDSITELWERQGYVHWVEMNTHYGNKLTNLGFSGDRTQNVIWRLLNGEFPPGINPEYVVLKIGTNNTEPAAHTAAGIGEIVKIIHQRSPQTIILLFSILPRGSGLSYSATQRNSDINNMIKNYDGYLNIRYIDIFDSYLNPDGSLKTELFYDNLHMTTEGFEIWKNKIIEIIGD